VTSLLKRNTNRRNASKSTGPRSARGKLHSRMNARTHGLNIPVTVDPKVRERVLQITRSIVGDAASDQAMEQAIIIAEAELELQRVKQMEVAVADKALGTRGSRGILKNARKFARAIPTAPTGASASLPEAFVRAHRHLVKLRRYKSRIYTRSTKAIRQLCKIGFCKTKPNNDAKSTR
jgi:hypothetical protein